MKNRVSNVQLQQSSKYRKAVANKNWCLFVFKMWDRQALQYHFLFSKIQYEPLVLVKILQNMTYGTCYLLGNGQYAIVKMKHAVHNAMHYRLQLNGSILLISKYRQSYTDHKHRFIETPR